MQKNVSIMEHCSPEQLQTKKTHVLAGQPIALCVRERLGTIKMRRQQLATVHTTLWVGLAQTETCSYNKE